jgi:hypothetical protein
MTLDRGWRPPAPAVAGLKKVSVAKAYKSKAGSRDNPFNCLEKLPKPAHYSSGVRKHWARLGLRLLPLFRNGFA